MPVTAAPDAASAVRSWLLPPARPLTGACIQFVPSAEVQTAASRSAPAWPTCAAAVNPAELLVSAVKVIPGPGALNGTGCQLRPPSVDRSASGRMPSGVVCWPSATTRLPLTATCWITPAEAPSGSCRLTVVQARPSGLIHTAGLLSAEPADTKPDGP